MSLDPVNIGHLVLYRAVLKSLGLQKIFQLKNIEAANPKKVLRAKEEAVKYK
jgi:nicotinic acid mononucleotide adenylyltransferase